MRSYSGSFGPGRLRGGMFLISMFRCQRCSMSGLDFRALGNPRNSVQCVTTTSTSLNCNGR